MRINDWGSEATRKKVRNLIAPPLIGPTTRLVLTNAIYMKANWSSEFPVHATRDGDLHAPDGTTKAKMMHQQSRFRFARAGGVRVLELPYRGGGLSMLIALPDRADELEESRDPSRRRCSRRGMRN
jgi:serpin B